MLGTRVNEYRNRLLDMRARLRDEMSSSLDAIREEVHVPGEDNQEPSEGLDKELALEATQAGIHDLVVAALQRIEDGTYGRCLDCGADIPDERLNAVPYTEYCIRCERRHEAE
jgi:DnaK suppressor protein